MGKTPPLLVGHAKTILGLRSGLNDILRGGTGDAIVLYGPRGNGKTALLNELAGWAEEGNAQVRLRSANEIVGGQEEIARALLGGGEEHEVTASVRADLVLVKAGITLKSAQRNSITAALAGLAATGPTVLLIDEAHVLSPSGGKALLNSIQVCIAGKLPLLAVLAGTPGIYQNFRKMEASFWERCTSLKVGRLASDAEARTGLSDPAQRSNLPLDDDALDLLVAEAQRYPFFIQLLGRASWDVADLKGHARISLADAQEGLIDANEQREKFYGIRRSEIIERDLYEEALVVSRVIVDLGPDPAVPASELDRVLGAVLDRDRVAVERAKNGLTSLGLIWETTAGIWEPGIPSLCRFIVEQHTEI